MKITFPAILGVDKAGGISVINHPGEYTQARYELYEEDAFVPNQYNRFDGFNDYQFMLDMFNKRDKSTITRLQHRKIRGIIVGSIRPYLEKQLADRIRG